MSQISLASFFHFLHVGASATLLHYAILPFMVCSANSTIGVASATDYMLSALYNYQAKANFTFDGGHSHVRSLPRFVLTALVVLSINQIVLLGLLRIPVHMAFAQLVATAAVLYWNYLVNATWTFARRYRS